MAKAKQVPSKLNISALVAKAARETEKRHGVVVSAERQYALIERSEERRSEIKEAVQALGLSHDDIVNNGVGLFHEESLNIAGECVPYPPWKTCP